jgi:hypothetical protein
MYAVVRSNAHPPVVQYVGFAAGLLLLAATWVIIYGTEALFTEAFLVGYYCCVTDADLPALGTWARSISDFFHGAPGKHLPSLLFIAVNAAFLLTFLHNQRTWHRQRTYWIPFAFALTNVLYVLTTFMLVSASWAIAASLLGPQLSAYKGFDRTWLGIASHLLLWALLWAGQWIVLAKLRLRQTVKTQIVE